MSSAALAGIASLLACLPFGLAIGLAAALAGVLALRLRSGQAWRTRRLIDLDRRMQFIEEYYSQEGEEYAAIGRAEADAGVDFANGEWHFCGDYSRFGFPRDEREAGVDFRVGYDARIEPFERYLEGLDAREN